MLNDLYHSLANICLFSDSWQHIILWFAVSFCILEQGYPCDMLWVIRYKGNDIVLVLCLSLKWYWVHLSISWDSCYYCESKPRIECWRMRDGVLEPALINWLATANYVYFLQLHFQFHHTDRVKLLQEWLLTCLCGSKYFLNFISLTWGPNSVNFSAFEVLKFLKSFFFFYSYCKLATFFWVYLSHLIHFVKKSPATKTQQYLFSNL